MDLNIYEFLKLREIAQKILEDQIEILSGINLIYDLLGFRIHDDENLEDIKNAVMSVWSDLEDINKGDGNWSKKLIHTVYQDAKDVCCNIIELFYSIGFPKILFLINNELQIVIKNINNDNYNENNKKIKELDNYFFDIMCFFVKNREKFKISYELIKCNNQCISIKIYNEPIQ